MLARVWLPGEGLFVDLGGTRAHPLKGVQNQGPLASDVTELAHAFAITQRDMERISERVADCVS